MTPHEIRELLKQHIALFTDTPHGREARICKDPKAAPGYSVSCPRDDDDGWLVHVRDCHDKNIALDDYLLMLDDYASRRSIARGLA